MELQLSDTGQRNDAQKRDRVQPRSSSRLSVRLTPVMSLIQYLLLYDWIIVAQIPPTFTPSLCTRPRRYGQMERGSVDAMCSRSRSTPFPGQLAACPSCGERSEKCTWLCLVSNDSLPTTVSILPFASSHHNGDGIMDDDMRCQYQSANCDNPRSLKDNGQPHGLCVFHREKANTAQRRWQIRHKDTVGDTPVPTMKGTSFERRAFARLSASPARAAAKIQRAGQRRRAVVSLEGRGSAQRWRSRVVKAPDMSDLTQANDNARLPMDDDDLNSLMMLVLEHDRTSRWEDQQRSDEDSEFVDILETWGQSW